VVIIPLWKFVEAEVRAAVAVAAPGLAQAIIQNFGKLLGIFIGPGADTRQWSAVREELRSRSRFLASLGLAWSGTLPLYRSHVLPVASHLAQMCKMPPVIFSTEASCIAIALKTPYRSVPVGLLRSGRSFGLAYDMPDLRTLGLAATFRAAENSGVLGAVVAEQARARKSNLLTLSPFLRDWTHEGVVGHMQRTFLKIKSSMDLPPLVGRGLQGRVTLEIRKSFNIHTIEATLRQRAEAMIGAPVTHEAINRMRIRLIALRAKVPQVVLSSMIRSICNAWTTSGRFSGPRSVCPFGCQAPNGDRWSHFPVCSAIRRMWAAACPQASEVFLHLTLEKVLFLSPDLQPEEDVQVALWSDVVGHCANDIRALGTAPSQVFLDGEGMIAARLRFLAVQSGPARAVISSIRVAVHALP
jgi:hypothetical protein